MDAHQFLRHLKSLRRPAEIVGVVLLVLLIALVLLARGPFDDIEGEPTWGVTFSVPYADALGLDWKATFIALLEDLGVKKFRIPAYWTMIEPQDDTWDFDDIDWMLEQAHRHDADVLLVIGRRLPRWPECHTPGWASDLSEEEVQRKILEMLEVVVIRYRDHPTVSSWQIDNEPYVEFFGECPKPDKAFLEREVSLVRSLDAERDIVMTDSGELGSYWRTARHADVLGTTMYKIVPRGNTRFGYSRWYLPAWFYRKKANLAHRISPNFDRLIVTELQAEPWAGNKFITELTPQEQDQSVDLKQLRQNIEFARQARISEIYLWGAEWWYWTKVEQGRPEFWEEVRPLFIDT